METEQRCVNCHSRRRSVYRGKHCRKCYPWHLKARRLQKERGGTPRAEKLHLMSGPERVLEEYAWREENLNAPDVDPLAVQSLVYAVAAECRSEIGFPIHSMLNHQTAEARRCLYILFLAILENTPCSSPRFRKWKPPRKGQYCDGGYDEHMARIEEKYGRRSD